MIERLLSTRLKGVKDGFPIVAIIGPRQSGKTTLSRHFFPNYDYVSLEDWDNRRNVENDPRGFLKNHTNGLIIDEAQHVPALFSYLQTHVDAFPGKFVLTGSQNFMLLEKISQSLAGRVALLTLFPLCLKETSANLSVNEFLLKGFYPALYSRNVLPQEWYSSYIQTYIDRDVRLIRNIENLSKFQLFLKLCAGRIGNLINLNEIANECGMVVNTVKSWLSVLEASYIIFLQQPYYKNFKKRLVKQPKLYFYDTGLACNLLGIREPSQLQSHYLRGALFENMIVADVMKHQLQSCGAANCWFWRDHLGEEVDLIVETSRGLVPIEIKSGQTINADYFKNINRFSKFSGVENGFVIYGGDQCTSNKNIKVLSWKKTADFCENELK